MTFGADSQNLENYECITLRLEFLFHLLLPLRPFKRQTHILSPTPFGIVCSISRKDCDQRPSIKIGSVEIAEKQLQNQTLSFFSHAINLTSFQFTILFIDAKTLNPLRSIKVFHFQFINGTVNQRQQQQQQHKTTRKKKVLQQCITYLMLCLLL